MNTSSVHLETPQGESFSLLRNRLSNPQAPWSDAQNKILNEVELERARATISSWPGYQNTALISLPAFASHLGVKSLHYKDESSRFGLGSFKALGGAYAVGRLLQRQVSAHHQHSKVDVTALLERQHDDVVERITVCCATDGNHGRSVAWGAQQFGCRCVIFIHATVSEGRRQAIENFGATVIRTKGNYDDSVREAQKQAVENNWFVVSDTSYEGYVDIPKDVMQGYELMVAEADEQLPDKPTHVFIQTGVGGVAAAVAGYFARRYGHQRPAIILADPEQSACWVQTLEAGEPTAAIGDTETIMAGLACGEVSLLAWTILRDHADAVIGIPDAGVAPAMQRLAMPLSNDPNIVAGESAVAGVLALNLAAQVPQAREALCLGPNARVLAFGTEGDTDPDLYQRLVGYTGSQVRQRRQ